jgi:hypothetical protein
MDEYFELEALILTVLKKANTALEEIENLPDPLVPQGTLGTGEDDLPDLPVDPAPTIGDTYFVATDGTYGGKPAHVGDTFFYNKASAWSYVPTGDIDTWRNVFVNGVEVLSIADKSPLKFKGGQHIKLEVVDGEIIISVDGTLPVPIIYGFHIDPDESDPEDKVTYLADAAGFSPAYMDYTNNKFVYGSWKDAFFMPKTCMLKPNGTVDFYLDPSDDTKREDGVTPSHVDHLGNIELTSTSSAAYAVDDYIVYDDKLWQAAAAIAIGDTLEDGVNITEVENAPNVDDNAMVEWGQNGNKIWYKIVPDDGDNTGASIYISNQQVDDGYRAWSFINHGGILKDHFYTPIYDGTIDKKNRLRSIMHGNYSNLCQNKNVTQEVAAAELNNPDNMKIWYTEQLCDDIIGILLLVLMAKSTDMQTAYGKGCTGKSSAASSMISPGTMSKKGMFWGSKNGTDGVKVFGMENKWGNQWRRFAGLVMVDYVQKYKMTRSTADGSGALDYNQTGEGYLIGGTGPSSAGYVSKMEYNSDAFFDNSVTNGNSNVHYCDYWYPASGTRYALRGGNCYYGARAGAFYVVLNVAASDATWPIGAALSCKPL